ncbi:MAG: alpha-2-macroglobulin family protein, partial [Verrucomicrobia bacterium]|nr:alpha-2-macroglobulin family protein [Cytophagales bacterium]
MKHLLTYSFAHLVMVLLLFSCGKGDKVRVVNKNFSEEVNLQQNLIFSFSHDLVADSLVNNWDSTAYIEFEPKVRGKFKWTAPDELVFSPDMGFAPATEYKATLTSEVLKKEKKTLGLDNEKTFNFHTPYLNIEKVTAFWAKSVSGSPQIRYQMAFNYKVNPAEVANLTSIKNGNQTLTVKAISTNLSENVQLAIDANDDWQGKMSEIIVKADLKTENGKQSKQEIKTSIPIPDREPLRITEMYSEYEGETGICYIHTNQSPGNQEVKDLISIDPAIDVAIEKQDFGYIVKGSFQPGTYSFTFSNQLRGVFGNSLGEDFTQTVSFGEMRPNIAFASERGFYLTSKGSKNIGVRISGLEKVRVTLYKIYENNVLPFMRQGGYMGDYGYYDEVTEDYQDNGNNPYGDVIYSKEMNVKDLRKEGGIYYLNMGFRDINNLKGMYAVKVASTEENWVNASKMLSVSDIGLVVKQTDDEIYVFANSILTAEPLSGVNVSLISSNNQVLVSGKTDGKGVIKLSEIKKNSPKFKVAMVSATFNEDFNFITFDENRTETSRYDVGGLRENATGYQAFVYGDRDLYRPGETMFINTVIRDGSWKSVGEVPVKIRVVAPNGKEFSVLKGILNKQSAFATQITFPTSSVTGTYNLEVYTANDVLLTGKSVSVEEFMPDRIKVTVKTSKPDYRSGESVNITATAQNLFGPPASGRNYELTYSLTRKEFFAKDYKDYNFSINADKTPTFEQLTRQGETDGQGNLTESFQIPANYEDLGILQGNIYTTVFDESGRPVNRRNAFDVITQNVFYGIKLTDYYAGTGEAINMPIVALNKDGKPVAGTTAQVKVIRTVYETVLRKSNYGSIEYVSQKKEFVMETKNLPINASGTVYSFIPQVSGEYAVIVSRPGSKAAVSSTFYAYGFGTSAASFETSKEGQILMQPDKEKYKSGEKAKILLQLPFAGKVLISVERNKVFEQFYVESKEKSVSVDINLKDEYLPNVYVSATLIKPLTNTAIPLTVAHGFVSLAVENATNQLPVEISAVALARSKTKQIIIVKTKANAEVTLAIVDEGILQIKNYQSPNPFEYFFQKRALEVSSFDIYPRLFPELNINKSSSGGDGMVAGEMAGRVNPLANKRVTLVSFWSGTLTANGNGEATYTIDLPQFSGDLRIMAVAYKDKAFGAGTKNMKVADPIVIASALPRFLSPGDQLQMPVTLSNTTNQTAQAQVSLRLAGGISPQGAVSQSVSIPANGEVQVNFAVNAPVSVGNASVEILVNALGATFSDKTDITIRPIQSLLKANGSGTVSGGKSQNISLATNFIPATIQAKLVVSKSPVAEFAGNLNYLLEYPYGCVEQTTSTAFPQIYFANLSQSLSPKRASNFTLASQNKGTGAAYNVQQAINKLSAMQLYNGALSYWPEGGKESWWGTAYA